MTKFMIMVSAAIFLSAGVAQAASYAPRPGGKGMPLVTKEQPKPAALSSNCDELQLSERNMARRAIIAGGSAARVADSVDGTCRTSMGASSVQGSYAKR